MEEKSHKPIYVVIIVAIVALMALGVAMYPRARDTREARAKAQEYITALEAAGYAAPKEDVLVELYGSDGGQAAQDPAAALGRWQYAAQLGTAGPASREVILDPRFVEAEEIFLSVYAPDQLPEFRQFVATLKLGATITDQ